MKTYLTVIFLFCGTAVFSQSLAAIEKDLLNQFRQIYYWLEFKSAGNTIDKYDSLEKANASFREMLMKYTQAKPATLNYGFPELKEEGSMTITTSDDGLFRIYSWNKQTGGTMRFFENVYQYKTGGKVFSKIIPANDAEGDPGAWYSAIYSLKNSGRTYYLGIRNAILSSKDLYQGIKVFTIGRNALDDRAKLIKTKTGIKNEIGFYYNFFSLKEDRESSRLFQYNRNAQTIHFPVVLEDDSVTKKYIVYKFTGRYFERMK